ncbi:MAG: hypothetical protein ACON5A_01885 [Candidatus Comchoanobacterales bacterium]
MFRKTLSIFALILDLGILCISIYFYLNPVKIMLSYPWLTFAAFTGAQIALFNICSHLLWFLHLLGTQQIDFRYYSCLQPNRYPLSWLRFFSLQVLFCFIVYTLPYLIIPSAHLGLWSIQCWIFSTIILSSIQLLWLCTYKLYQVDPHTSTMKHLVNVSFWLTSPIYLLLHPHIISQLLNFRNWEDTPRTILSNLGGDFSQKNADGWSGWHVYLATRNYDVVKILTKKRKPGKAFLKQSEIPQIKYDHQYLGKGTMTFYEFAQQACTEQWKQNINKRGLFGYKKSTYKHTKQNLWFNIRAIIFNGKQTTLPSYPKKNSTIDRIVNSNKEHQLNPNHMFYNGSQYIQSDKSTQYKGQRKQANKKQWCQIS